MTLPGGPAPSYPSMPWGFAGVGPDESPLESSRVVVLPVPYDSTTSYRGGAREGPSRHHRGVALPGGLRPGDRPRGLPRRHTHPA